MAKTMKGISNAIRTTGESYQGRSDERGQINRERDDVESTRKVMETYRDITSCRMMDNSNS